MDAFLVLLCHFEITLLEQHAMVQVTLAVLVALRKRSFCNVEAEGTGQRSRFRNARVTIMTLMQNHRRATLSFRVPDFDDL